MSKLFGNKSVTPPQSNSSTKGYLYSTLFIPHFPIQFQLSFLKRLLPVFKSLGATGLLIEYEDMFPYSGPIESIRAENAYRAEDLKVNLKIPFECQAKIRIYHCHPGILANSRFA